MNIFTVIGIIVVATIIGTATGVCLGIPLSNYLKRRLK